MREPGLNYKLQAARERHMWTQEDAAEQVGVDPQTYWRWENGMQRPRAYALRKLCAVFDLSAEDLGFGRSSADFEHAQPAEEREQDGVPSTDDMLLVTEVGPIISGEPVTQALNQTDQLPSIHILTQEEVVSLHQLIRSKNIDMNKLRRKLLQLGIVGATTLIVAPSANFVESDIRINDGHVALLENEMISRWMLYYTGGAARASVGFDLWVQDASRSAQLTRGTSLYERAHLVLCMSYQLQGCILRDTLHFPEAHKAFRKAFLIAQELHNPELMGASLAREGVTLTQQDLISEAIIYLNHALDVVRHLGFLTLEGYILQGLSEAQARDQSQGSWKSLECAENLLGQQSQMSEGSLTRFNAASVIAQRGVNAALLQDYRGCIELIDKSLRIYDPTLVRGRARLIVQKAEAHWQLREIDACALQAQEAFLLASSAGASKTVDRAKNLHTMLLQSPFRKERGVTELSEVISPRNI